MSSMQANDAISDRSNERYEWDPSTEYWKLPLPDLEDVKDYADRSGCAYTIDHHREFVRHYSNRRHLKLFAYEDCTMRELTRFCQQRGLDITRPVQETMMMYEYDENSATMVVVSILVEMSPVCTATLLRCSMHWTTMLHFTASSTCPQSFAPESTPIYSTHREPADALELPDPPPITKASRLLRTESLPAFYQICLFARPNLSTGSTTHPLSRVAFLPGHSSSSKRSPRSP